MDRITLSEFAPSRLFSLEGRTVFITGGAGGIALGLCKGFAAAGARLILVDRNEAVEQRAAALREAGAQATAFVFDITDPAAVAEAIARARAETGRLDVLVNNAAIIVRKHFLELTLEEWRRVTDIDLTASFTVAQQAARIMVEQGSGRIINLSSIMNHVSRPLLTPKVTAKGAIAAFTRAVAADLGGTGVTINALAPGYTATEFSQANQKDFHDSSATRPRPGVGERRRTYAARHCCSPRTQEPTSTARCSTSMAASSP